jgi:glycosyltransferase involved in cell wall biosynthesis
MNVLQISTTDGTGGASRAARRLHDALRRRGVRSRMAVGRVTVGGEDVVAISATMGRPRLGDLLRAEQLVPRLGSLVGELSLPYPSSRLLGRTEIFSEADVIHLHNLHGRYFDYRVLRRWSRSHPVVWTLHDMWAFTGHCAYSFDCERWREGCGPCPLFDPRNRGLDEIPQPPWDNTGAEWRRKHALYGATPLAVVAPSRWLLELAKQSVLARHPGTSFHHVPHGVDTDVYRPVPPDHARDVLRLRRDGSILLFSAASLGQERKGLRYLVEALRGPALRDRDLQVLMLGPTNDLDGALPQARWLGPISDEHLQAVAYSAADLVVVPSLADNQPLTALEAMACGTPVAATKVGGLPELVRDRETGVLFPPRDSGALEASVAQLLDDPQLRRRLSDGARQLVLAHHRLEEQADAYREIYRQRLRERDYKAGPCGC